MLWSVPFLLCAVCFAQGKVDLEVKAFASSKTARGGESFSYTITVSNIGSARATDVMLVQTELRAANFVSNVPSRGTCAVDDREGRGTRILRCKLGDIEPGETIVTAIELKIRDFGDLSEAPDKRYKLPSLQSLPDSIQSSANSNDDSLAVIDVSAEEREENKENNYARVSVRLLPSKNIPPRVQIVAPENETVITRSAKKLARVTFTIKAFDPDGKIERVRVNTQQFDILIGSSENLFVIEGKSYTSKELEDNKDLQKYFGGDAKRIAPDTYTFTLENPKYGLNVIFVEAVDDGGRAADDSVRLTVKGDNSIEFTKPLQNSVIKPGTNVVIETLSKLNDGSEGKFELIGNQICCGNPPLMKQISRRGNDYVHQYIWENIAKGYYNLQIFLTEDTGAFTYSGSLQFKVTEKPAVRIISPRPGQTFKAGEKIPIEIEAADPDGTIKDVSVKVNGKYESKFDWRPERYGKSGDIDFLSSGIYRITATAVDEMDVETESESITIIVK
ncbi:MAG: hypothetical protein JSS81_22660 [Acidobacteria bacterium]|nr:hypothetical protein [Acidobacteriota bacterium]